MQIFPLPLLLFPLFPHLPYLPYLVLSFPSDHFEHLIVNVTV